MSVGVHTVGVHAVGIDRLTTTIPNTTISPNVGSMVITGYAPTVTQTTNQSLTAANGSMTITGYAPSISQTANGPISITAGAGTMAITGYAPSISQTTLSPANIEPNVGAMTITGYAPTVTQSGGATPAPAGDGGGAGNIREVRRFADLLTRPTKEMKRKRRKIIETEALMLLPDEPEAEKVAQVIAQVIVRQEAQRYPRWVPPRAMMPVSIPEPEYDVSEIIQRMVDEWLANEAIKRELEDEEDIEMLLLG